MSQLKEEVASEISKAAYQTCTQIRTIHRVADEFLHLPEQCQVCQLLEARITQAYLLGKQDAAGD